MPNYLQNLRLQNLFGQPMDFSSVPMGNDMPSQGGFGGNLPQTNPYSNLFQPQPIQAPPPAPEGYDVGSRMSQLYTPEHQASDKFSSLINAYPEDKGHSKLARIGAALLAGGTSLATDDPIKGYNLGTGALEYQRNKKVADWKNQITPAQQGANLERQSNTNERTLAYQTISQELRQQAEEHKASNDVARTKIASDRADIYRFKAEHPDMKIVMTKGGNVQMIDPKTGSMTELDKLHLQQENAIEKVHVTGEESRKTEEVKQGGRVELEGVKQGGRESLLSKKNKAGGTELPTQTRVREYNQAKELKDTNPNLGKWIKINPQTHDYQISPVGTPGMFGKAGPTEDEYNQIIHSIYGPTLAISQPTRTGVPSNGPNGMQSPTSDAPKAPTGWKYVKKPGGGWTAVQDK
jgi:hypothetical protein